MNPPFGAASLAAKKEFEAAYPAHEERHLRGVRGARDPAAASRAGCSGRSPRGPASSCRASRSGARRSSSRKRRRSSSRTSGYGVMDSAMVEAAAYCAPEASATCDDGDLHSGDRRPMTSSEALRPLPRGPQRARRYEIDLGVFRAIPRVAICLLGLPQRSVELFEVAGLRASVADDGASRHQTCDDFQFLQARAGRSARTAVQTGDVACLREGWSLRPRSTQISSSR